MDLHSMGREFYKLAIVTVPTLSAWEASFDDGTTFTAGEAYTDAGGSGWRWLVAGADAAIGTADAQISGSVDPLLRDVDNPEIIVRGAPGIHYRT